MTLKDWGWNRKWEEDFSSYRNEGWKPGRVLRPGRGIYRIVAELEDDDAQIVEKEARLTGKARGRGETPAAGDWVSWREEGGSAIIGAVLPRKTVISRKVPGESSREQIIGVNVDVLFVVQALGGGRSFTPRGLERYITMAWESGCRPVVILNKIDLAENPAADMGEAEAVAAGVDIIACSTITGDGIDEVKNLLPPGLTGAFVGPSGVGKSSILNAVAGNFLADTGEVREADRRGRHTTTHRELHRLPDGRLLLDTPGLRELQLWGEAGSADAAFPEIEELAALCRFNDCRHDREPGCEVRAGLENGRIDPERFDSWLELKKELAWLETRRGEKNRKKSQQQGLYIAKFAREIKTGKEVW